MSEIRRGGPNMKSSEDQVGAYQDGRMPWWLFAIWAAFLVWGAIYFIWYGIPDLKRWASPNPPVKEATRE